MSETVPPSIEPISDDDWAQTPDSVKRYLLGRIKQLERQYEELKAENAMLREQIGRNSQNSPLYSNGEILVAKEVSPAKTPENNWLQARYSGLCAEYSCAPDSVGWIAHGATII